MKTDMNAQLKEVADLIHILSNDLTRLSGACLKSKDAEILVPKCSVVIDNFRQLKDELRVIVENNVPSYFKY